jgi:hypothetical protein
VHTYSHLDRAQGRTVLKDGKWYDGEYMFHRRSVRVRLRREPRRDRTQVCPYHPARKRQLRRAAKQPDAVGRSGVPSRSPSWPSLTTSSTPTSGRCETTGKWATEASRAYFYDVNTMETNDVRARSLRA